MAEELILTFLKYFLEGTSVSVAAYYLSGKKTSIQEVLTIGLTAAVVFMLLDMFAPSIGASTRQGAGMGIGLQRVGFEPYANEDDSDDDVPTTTETTTRHRYHHTTDAAVVPKARKGKKARRVTVETPDDSDVEEEYYNYNDEHFVVPGHY